MNQAWRHGRKGNGFYSYSHHLNLTSEKDNEELELNNYSSPCCDCGTH